LSIDKTLTCSFQILNAETPRGLDPPIQLKKVRI